MRLIITFFCLILGLTNADDILSEQCVTNNPCGPCEAFEDGMCVPKDCGPCNFCDLSTDRCVTYDCGTCGTCKDEKCLDCSDLCEPCSTCEYGECQPPTECCDEIHCHPCQDCVQGRCVDRDCGPCNGCNRGTDRCEQKSCGECGVCKDDVCVDCSDLCPICSSCENGRCNKPLECCDSEPCGPCDECVDGQCLPRECGPCNRCNEATDRCESTECGPCAYCEDGECVNMPCGYCGFCNMETGQCEQYCTQSGDAVIHNIYICTKKCDGCDYQEKEIMALRLIGEEENLGQPDCLTNKLVLPGPGQCKEFIHSNEILGGCYNYPIQRSLDNSAILEWKGVGIWSGSFCLSWFPANYMDTTCDVVDGKVIKCYQIDDCKNTQ